MTARLPKHRPYLHDGAMFQIGVKLMEPSRWLDLGDDHVPFMAAKRQRMAGRPALFYGAMPQSLQAQGELLRTLAAHLGAHHADDFEVSPEHVADRRDGSRHTLSQSGREPLEIAADLVEEDFILLENRDNGVMITAASNPYSSSGRIVSSVGHDMRFAHHPVPGLNDGLGPRIDRVLAHVKPGLPAVRFNWVVTAIGDRLFPAQSHAANAAASDTAAAMLQADHRKAGDLLWVRVERQTFLRLPETGALAFGIHTYSDPLSVLSEDRDSLSAMHGLLASFSKERLAYSAMTAIRAPVMRWIEDCLTG